jgi:hypothetical protein
MTAREREQQQDTLWLRYRQASRNLSALRAKAEIQRLHLNDVADAFGILASNSYPSDDDKEQLDLIKTDPKYEELVHLPPLLKLEQEIRAAGTEVSNLERQLKSLGVDTAP